MSSLIKRSFSLAGHRTSVALEQAFWDVLVGIAHARGQTLSGLVAAADAARGSDQALASALRVMALMWIRDCPAPRPIAEKDPGAT